MARHTSDREDLMREATALARRVEIVCPDETEPVIAGVREDGTLSLYFGADPAYHFDPSGRLRRAFVAGCLYRTQGHTLARLLRRRTASAVELLRHDLTLDELELFLASLRSSLVELREALSAESCRVLRQVPSDEDVAAVIAAALDAILAGETPLAPAIRGTR